MCPGLQEKRKGKDEYQISNKEYPMMKDKKAGLYS
jgi:hypothetical protein